MQHKIRKGPCGVRPGTEATDTYRNNQDTIACRVITEASTTETYMGEPLFLVAGKKARVMKRLPEDNVFCQPVQINPFCGK